MKVLRVDAKDRKIGLSRKNLYGGVTEAELAAHEATTASLPKEEEVEEAPSKEKRELRGGMGSGGPLIQMPEKEEQQ